MTTSVKITVMLLLVLLTSITIYAQEKKLYLILKKGTATFFAQNMKPVAEIQENKRTELPMHASLTLSRNSRAIVYNQNGSLEIGSTHPEKYQTDVLLTTLDKKDKTTATGRFFEFLNHTYYEMKKKAEFCGSVTGAASRGINDFFFSPNDSSVVICDTIRLYYGPEAHYKAIRNLVVVNTSTGDTVYDTKETVSSVNLSALKEGEYHWSTMIRTEDGQLMKMDNIFYVPAESKRKVMLEDFKQFRGMISAFSEETRESLLDEYLSQNNIYYLKNKQAK